MSDLIVELTKQLHGWQDETQWLSFDVVAEMLAQAAGAVVVGDSPGRITIHREVSPDDGQVWHVLSCDQDCRVIFDANDVATLRAILCTYDEHTPPQQGDPLSVPMRLADGRLITTWPGETPD